MGVYLVSTQGTGKVQDRSWTMAILSISRCSQSHSGKGAQPHLIKELAHIPVIKIENCGQLESDTRCRYALNIYFWGRESSPQRKIHKSEVSTKTPHEELGKTLHSSGV